MSVLFLVLPLALLIAAGAVAAFLWATRTGQFDDMETPAMRMLHDDEVPADPTAGPGDPAAADGKRESIRSRGRTP